MTTVFTALITLLQNIHNDKGEIATEAFLEVCQQIIPITGDDMALKAI